MSIRILVDRSGNLQMAALYDSVTDWAFGPVFTNGAGGETAEDRAHAFLKWLEAEGQPDARTIPDDQLERLHTRFIALMDEEND